MPLPPKPDWATTPIDLSRQRMRRLFAQELVTRLMPIGAATIAEMRALGLSFFKVPPEDDEVAQVAKVAARFGWVEQPADANSGEWTVSELGRTIPKPPSLGLDQVFTRLARVANPVRESAVEWLPLLAVVAGALTTSNYIEEAGTLDAVRILSLAVLTYALGMQVWGEMEIVRAVQTWADKLGRTKVEQRAISAQVSFYDWPRFCLAVLFDVAVLTTFGLLIFEAWLPGALSGGTALLIGAVLEFGWRNRLPGRWRFRDRTA